MCDLFVIVVKTNEDDEGDGKEEGEGSTRGKDKGRTNGQMGMRCAVRATPCRCMLIVVLGYDGIVRMLFSGVRLRDGQTATQTKQRGNAHTTEKNTTTHKQQRGSVELGGEEEEKRKDKDSHKE